MNLNVTAGNQYTVGTRVELTMKYDPFVAKNHHGRFGTVRQVLDDGTLVVKWDDNIISEIPFDAQELRRIPASVLLDKLYRKAEEIGVELKLYQEIPDADHLAVEWYKSGIFASVKNADAEVLVVICGKKDIAIQYDGSDDFVECNAGENGFLNTPAKNIIPNDYLWDYYCDGDVEETGLEIYYESSLDDKFVCLINRDVPDHPEFCFYGGNSVYDAVEYALIRFNRISMWAKKGVENIYMVSYVEKKLCTESYYAFDEEDAVNKIYDEANYEEYPYVEINDIKIEQTSKESGIYKDDENFALAQITKYMELFEKSEPRASADC